MITKDYKFNDTRQKVRHILINYNDIKNKIKILQSQIAVLKEALQSEDLICEFEIKSNVGIYDNSSIVEKEAFFNLSIHKKTKDKIELIKKDIQKYQLEININKAIISMINCLLNSFNKHDKELIMLYYIDRRRNNDTFANVCDKYNQVKKFTLSEQRIQQKTGELLDYMSRKLMNMQILDLHKMD